MTKKDLIENIAGPIFGLIGGAINKYLVGLQLIVILEYLPGLHEVISSIITAGLCAATGFVVTKCCHYLFIKFKKFLAKITKQSK